MEGVEWELLIGTEIVKTIFKIIKEKKIDIRPSPWAWNAWDLNTLMFVVGTVLVGGLFPEYSF